MILNILHDGDEILKRLSCSVILDDEIREFIGSMKETMIDANGIGLAAPQVGRNIRVIVVKLQYGDIQEMINPAIKWYSDHVVKIEEGCLSVPGKYVELISGKTAYLQPQRKLIFHIFFTASSHFSENKKIYRYVNFDQSQITCI